jgi:hypothetical protein
MRLPQCKRRRICLRLTTEINTLSKVAWLMLRALEAPTRQIGYTRSITTALAAIGNEAQQ